MGLQAAQRLHGGEAPHREQPWAAGRRCAPARWAIMTSGRATSRAAESSEAAREVSARRTRLRAARADAHRHAERHCQDGTGPPRRDTPPV
ncbi:hypothetical protein SMICM304S_08579 [Streptomyces microflavus]